MKFLFDLLPVLLFFIAFKLADIYVATAVAIATTFVQVAWLKLRGRRVETMLWASLAIVAVFGGALFETAQLAVPRFIRRSRFYEATAKNLLRVAIEVVGGVQGSAAHEPEAPAARQIAVRKGAGNVVELGSIAAFGFSPLWLLAAASDLLRGSRVYLNALVDELKAEGVVATDAHFGSVDELLGALERGTGRTASLIDIPPLELEGLRATVGELRSDVASLPSQEQLAELYRGLRRTAAREQRRAAKDYAEEPVEHRRFPLDEGLVLQGKRRAAEHDDDGEACPQHRVYALAGKLEPTDLNECRRYGHGGGDIDIGQLERNEEQQDRGEIEEKLHAAAGIL